MKTKQELENIKEEIEKLNAELHELTDEELEQVTGGECKIKPVTIDEIKIEVEPGFKPIDRLEIALEGRAEPMP